MTMNRKRLLSLLLVLIMLLSMLPLSAVADDGELEDVSVQTEEPAGEPLDEYVPEEENLAEPGNEYAPAEVSVSCDVPGASVKIYGADAPEVEIQQEGDGFYRLPPGTYYYTAEAEGYADPGMTPFDVEAGADNTVNIGLTPEQADAGEPQEQLDTAEPQEQEEDTDDEENLPEQISGGIFYAHYGRNQVFSVYRSPAFPTGTQGSPNDFTVMDLAAPDLAEADYYYFVPLGPASRKGVPVSLKWNAAAEGLDPYAVALHAVKGETDSEIARGVIGALSAEGFLFDADGNGAWFSNSKGYRYSSTAITYKPVDGGRLVCDVNLLTGCAAGSMLEPADDAPDHVHNWMVRSEGATAVYWCSEDGCPYDNHEYTMSLTIPAVVASGSSAKAVVERSAGGDEWPVELEQDVVYYIGRGETEYARSTTPPTAEGTYTAQVSVGYRYLTSKLEADFAISYNMTAEEETVPEEEAVPEEAEEVEEVPAVEEPKPFSSTQVYGGVVVTVSAAAGVFPNDAVLSVTEPDNVVAMGYAAAALRTADQTSLASTFVDVKVVGADGAPVYPANGSPVSVSLSLAEPAAAGLTTAFYRILRDREGCMYAAEQPGNGNGGSVAAVELGDELLYVVEVQKVVTMPAQDFENYTGNLHVMVSAPEGAFPRGTVMVVTPVYDQDILQTIGDEVGADASRVTAVDIKFYNINGKEIEPEIPISVTLKSEVIAAAEEPTVVHMDDEGNTEVMEQAENPETDEVTFDAESFSVYAVVDGSSGEEARATVNFWSGSTKVATYYVKNSDDANELKKIVTDPGAGTLETGLLFRGWTDNRNYTTETEPMDIQAIRDELEGMSITEGDVVNYYAMIFKFYNVIYFGDDVGISLGDHTILLKPDETQADYQVSMAYTPDSHQNFKGWKPTDDTKANIVSPVMDIYPNETDVVIQGDVVFNVEAPTGNWLYYHGNGKGATFNAPQFYLSNETTEPAINATPENMKRNGYTFGGWYTKLQDVAPDSHGYVPVDESSAFTFGSTLSDNTDIYAKWTAKTVAPYTVILWGQNVDRTAYEVLGSYVNNNGAVGQNIPYTVVDNGAEDYVTGVGNNNGHYTGFGIIDADKNQSVVITPEGDAVLNLHFNRIEYNVRFYIYWQRGDTYYYGNNSSAHGNTFGVVTTHTTTNSNNLPSTTRATQTSVVRSNNNNGTNYDNTERDYNATYFVLSAYYGEDISQKWPKYSELTGVGNNQPVSFVMMVGTELKPNPSAGGDGTVKGLVTTLDKKILGATNDPEGNFLIVRFPNSSNNWRYHIWYEVADPENPPAGARTYNGKIYYEADVLEVRSSNTDIGQQNAPKYSGFADAFRRNQNWNGDGSWTTQNPTLLHINYVYDRLKYSVEYFDGQYVNGNGQPIQNRATHLLHESDPINQGAVIPDSDKNYVPSLPEGEEGYVFAGWYLDEACTVAYPWGIMPVGGVKVYAKWQQIQYRVFLHPNAYLDDEQTQKDETLDWHDQSTDPQQMNFRITYGDKVSLPYGGTRDGYEFVGWYKDPGLKSVYAEATELNDETVPVTPVYNKETDLTDPMDKWGEIIEGGSTTPYNSDVNRSWITRKLDLYGKWRKIIVGADGINVFYTTKDGKGHDGTGAPTDPLKYTDAANAVAQAACTPYVYNPKVKFAYWVVQRWDETAGEYVDTNVTVYPGDGFTVKLDDAKRVENSGHTPENPSYTYTVQLRPEYIPMEIPKDTYFNWYRNWSSSDTVPTGRLHQDEGLQINEARKIYTLDSSVPTREGYKFLGWARATEIDETHTDPITYHVLNKNDLYLIWDGSKYLLASDQTKTITHVAADDIQPYQAFYAVWAIEINVTKRVTGNMGDVNKTFTINVSSDIEFTYGDNSVTSAQLSLINGQSALLSDVAAGSKFTVSETGATGYTQKYYFKVGGTETEITPTNYTITEGGTIIVENNKEVTPDTGVSLSSIPFVLMLSLSVLGFGGMVFRRRREQE